MRTAPNPRWNQPDDHAAAGSTSDQLATWLEADGDKTLDGLIEVFQE
jgi:hypothetical protein